MNTSILFISLIRLKTIWVLIILLSLLPPFNFCQNPTYIAFIVNSNSELSADIATYYMDSRNTDYNILIFNVNCTTDEIITEDDYINNIRDVLREAIEDSGYKDSIKYLITTKDMPLKVIRYTGQPPCNYFTNCWSPPSACLGHSLESMLTIIFDENYDNYKDLDSLPNPFYGEIEAFQPFQFSNQYLTMSYLTSRIDAYDFETIMDIIDRSETAFTGGTGLYVLDDDDFHTYDRMYQARTNLINLGLGDYVIYDPTNTNITSLSENPSLISYCGHGRHAQYGNPPYNPFMGWNPPIGYLGMAHFVWANGAVFNSYESFNAWSFYYDDIGCSYYPYGILLGHVDHQNLIADFFKDGGTVAVGHVFEPYASGVANEAILFPMYASGSEFGEAAWASIPYIPWRNTVVGDPLCVINIEDLRKQSSNENKNIISKFIVLQNYPNPFNPSTRISFSLAVDSKVNLKVFDVLGQEVASLINQDLTAGIHYYDFNATGINSGVYFYKIQATGVNGNEFTDVKKMILVK